MSGVALSAQAFATRAQSDRPQQRIARHFREHPGELPLADSLQRLVERFTGRVIQIDHAMAEVFCTLRQST